MRASIRVSAVLVFLACAVTPRTAAAVEFALVHFDSFESCALSYADADADAHGSAFGVRHECDPLPPARIRVGGDCNDANGGIHVDAVEARPDGAFADENCDGVDGDVDVAIFVSPFGSSPPCGGRTTPCTLFSALGESLSSGRRQLYLTRGAYTGPFELNSGIFELHGGYDDDYAQRVPVAGSNATLIVGGPAPSGTIGVRAFASDVSLNDLRIVSPPATGQWPEGDGFSSVGLYVDEAIASVTRAEIVAGPGASGLAGADGSGAPNLAATSFMNGALGGDGDEENVACDSSSRGAGGNPGVNDCSAGPSTRAPGGGGGGAGGTMDTNCGAFSLNLVARPGQNGAAAPYVSGLAGSGGFGGSGGESCGPTTGGVNGAVADGGGGMTTDGFDVAFPLRLARAGGDGTTGENGGGGGGGGGSGGCDIGTDAYGAGGGGGGAGGCAALVAGKGGRGGGASIAIAVFDGSLTFGTGVVLESSAGGSGGDGGLGGSGQAPGLGNAGGAFPGTAQPGRGGDGGRGGHSGGGAGGNGGASLGVLLLFSPPVQGPAPTFVVGTPGLPGAGGAGPTLAASGQPGFAGPAGPIRACNAPAC